jgi:hypothetical protein
MEGELDCNPSRKSGSRKSQPRILIRTFAAVHIHMADDLKGKE